jgi:hypothetical protein
MFEPARTLCDIIGQGRTLDNKRVTVSAPKVVFSLYKKKLYYYVMEHCMVLGPIHNDINLAKRLALVSVDFQGQLNQDCVFDCKHSRSTPPT